MDNKDDNTDKHLEMVKHELANAKKKHPHFVNKVTVLRREKVSSWLEQLRTLLECMTQLKQRDVESILECELYEALDAYTEGDYEHAMQEFAQCAAVCIRAMEECKKAMERKDPDEATTSSGFRR
jgi:phage repressor protein C with HTH and peptisase S24 domain